MNATTHDRKPSPILQFPPDISRPPFSIIQFPKRRHRKPACPDPFGEKLEAWKTTFNHAATTDGQVHFSAYLTPKLWGALVTEAATYRMDVFEIARQMIQMGLDRFDAEQLEWTNLSADVPSNVIPLRLIRNVVKYSEEELPFSS